MSIMPAILVTVAKHIHHLVREVAFDDMARQASGWIPDEVRIESKVSNNPPIKLDFDIPRKHRLGWIHRAMHDLPH